VKKPLLFTDTKEENHKKRGICRERARSNTTMRGLVIMKKASGLPSPYSTYSGEKHEKTGFP
jgi:hypothetical protein